MGEVCGQVIYNEVGGRIESTRYLKYRNNMNCKVTIQVPDDQKILILLKHFETEHFNDECVDYLNIYDGRNTSSQAMNMEPLCGKQPRFQMETSGNFVTFHFVTDAMGVNSGFEFIYSAFVPSKHSSICEWVFCTTQIAMVTSTKYFHLALNEYL